MSELREFAREIITDPSNMTTGEAIGVGIIDTTLGTILIAHSVENDIASQLVGNVLTRPAGIALGAFGVLCLAQVVKRALPSH